MLVLGTKHTQICWRNADFQNRKLQLVIFQFLNTPSRLTGSARPALGCDRVTGHSRYAGRCKTAIRYWPQNLRGKYRKGEGVSPYGVSSYCQLNVSSRAKSQGEVRQPKGICSSRSWAIPRPVSDRWVLHGSLLSARR